MNIIEAARALKEGRGVVDPDGWVIHSDLFGFILHEDNSDYHSLTQNLLSEKWEVIDEHH